MAPPPSEDLNELAFSVAPRPGRRPVRPDIISSWERCLQAGLRPGRLEIPFLPDLGDGDPLRQAAAPIMDQVSEDLDGMGVALLLTDERGLVVDRRATERRMRIALDRVELAPGADYSEEHAGTTAVATAIAQRRPSTVVGSEHFIEALGRMGWSRNERRSRQCQAPH